MGSAPAEPYEHQRTGPEPESPCSLHRKNKKLLSGQRRWFEQKARVFK
jgi:hypothetical protein